MCDCIKEVEKLANDQMAIKVGAVKGAIITDPAEITTKAIGFVKGDKWRIYAPIEGAYSQGKKRSKWKCSLHFSFCPFCGESLTN